MRLPLKVRYQGGIAADGVLPLYDGTTAIAGFAQTLQIATHALLTKHIVTRATAARSANFFLLPARAGSYLTEMVTVVEQQPVAVGLSAAVFYDFLKTVLIKATSAAMPEPETSTIRRWIDRDEPFFDELAETLEGSLQRAHRPIGEDVTTISVERPRSQLLVFNQATKSWVNTRDAAADAVSFTGHVTRFNSITRNGRVYVDQLSRVIPMKPDHDFAMPSLAYLTWSLHGSANQLVKELIIDAREVKSASGETKRLLLVDCSREDQQP